MSIISLKSPTSTPIVGIKLQDGSIVDFQCHFSHSRSTPTFVYEVPAGAAEKLLKTAGDYILVDSVGGEWPSSDVEFISSPAVKG